ncbi:hypothetical protein DFJ58DRAFT_723866 [Suillus subalutaceus]|uniref:uncharacterized protein n=1 Tax=Suillus subalutaceus TaxID=48586 RepID=UPI001B87181C|nr:uncharacterized protein DFJ58DRAFT_723866 [Suillus subalutaceus]KAG1867174.1 hypothetical protein DFJ58DRAFT_723866 [Suillus subalutaceus]
MASLAESTSARSDVSSSLQSIADNVAKHVKLILPQVKSTPSELHSAALEVIDVDIDENDAPPAAEQDDEADLSTRTQENLAFSSLRFLSPTDDSNTYRIATVLHPGLKLEYFRLQK